MTSGEFPSAATYVWDCSAGRDVPVLSTRTAAALTLPSVTFRGTWGDEEVAGIVGIDVGNVGFVI